MTSFGLAARSVAAVGFVIATPVHGEIVQQGDAGFVLRQTAESSAPKDQVWRTLTAPAQWWSSAHTYSGDATNLYIDAQATGCFCEKLPRPADAPASQRMGSIEHMHVVYADPQRGVLRMVGGLGPLQGEAVHGVLTVALRPGSAGTTIEWTYAVGGYFTGSPAKLAPLVDGVLGEQLRHLAERADAVSAAPADGVSPS